MTPAVSTPVAPPPTMTTWALERLPSAVSSRQRCIRSRRVTASWTEYIGRACSRAPSMPSQLVLTPVASTR
jgi:hypothetical protein